MSILVTDDRVAAWVGEKVGSPIYPPYTCLGLEKDGQVVAGAVFNCYTGPNIEITVAALPGAITRAFLHECGRYVFDQLGCERATFTTEDPTVINLAQRLAAQTEGRMRNFFGKGRDGIVLGLLREDWKL